MMAPYHPPSIALSWTALNYLLCISTCLAAFCPSGVAPCRLGSRPDVVATFVGNMASWPRHDTLSSLSSSQQIRTLPTSLSLTQTPFAIYLENGRRNNNMLIVRAATPDNSVNDVDTSDASSTIAIDNNASRQTEANDNEEINDQLRQGVRARVRQSVTNASKKVKNLWDPATSSQVRQVVTLGATKGGSPIATVLTDAAVNAAELAAEEVRSAALDVLQRNNRKSNKNASLQLETSAQIEADAQVAMDAISLAKTSVADAFDAAESALSAVENELQRVRYELEVAKRDAALGLAVAEKAANDAAVKARRATETVVEAMVNVEEKNVVIDIADEGGEDGNKVDVPLQSDDVLELKADRKSVV